MEVFDENLLFTTYGSLRVGLLEAIDVIDQSVLKNKKLATIKRRVVATVGVHDERHCEVYRYNSASQPYHIGETVHIGEEFVFDGVSSAYSIIVSFTTIEVQKNGSTKSNIVGTATIPVNRLEENTPIVQWYQLFNVSDDGLRCAAKIEALFLSETGNRVRRITRGGFVHDPYGSVRGGAPLPHSLPLHTSASAPAGGGFGRGGSGGNNYSSAMTPSALGGTPLSLFADAEEEGSSAFNRSAPAGVGTGSTTQPQHLRHHRQQQGPISTNGDGAALIGTAEPGTEHLEDGSQGFRRATTRTVSGGPLAVENSLSLHDFDAATTTAAADSHQTLAGDGGPDDLDSSEDDACGRRRLFNRETLPVHRDISAIEEVKRFLRAQEMEKRKEKEMDREKMRERENTEGVSGSGGSDGGGAREERAGAGRVAFAMEEQNPRLDVGLIDYCLVLGPKAPSNLRPTHYVNEETNTVDALTPALLPFVLAAFETLNASTASAANGFTTATVPNSPGFGGESGLNGMHVGQGGPAPPGQQIGATMSNNSATMWWANPEELDVMVWDRLPRQDHPDIALPSKIEWFACPEGSKTVLHPNRPKPVVSTFVLCAGEMEELYGLSYTVFMRVDKPSFSASSSAAANMPSSAGSGMGGSHPGQQQQPLRGKNPLHSSPGSRPRRQRRQQQQQRGDRHSRARSDGAVSDFTATVPLDRTPGTTAAAATAESLGGKRASIESMTESDASFSPIVNLVHKQFSSSKSGKHTVEKVLSATASGDSESWSSPPSRAALNFSPAKGGGGGGGGASSSAKLCRIGEGYHDDEEDEYDSATRFSPGCGRNLPGHRNRGLGGGEEEEDSYSMNNNHSMLSAQMYAALNGVITGPTGSATEGEFDPWWRPLEFKVHKRYPHTLSQEFKRMEVEVEAAQEREWASSVNAAAASAGTACAGGSGATRSSAGSGIRNDSRSNWQKQQAQQGDSPGVSGQRGSSVAASRSGVRDGEGAVSPNIPLLPSSHRRASSSGGITGGSLFDRLLEASRDSADGDRDDGYDYDEKSAHSTPRVGNADWESHSGSSDFGGSGGGGGSSAMRPLKPPHLWTSVTICLLFRIPFVQPLTDCLHVAYSESILPMLRKWERTRFEAPLEEYNSNANGMGFPGVSSPFVHSSVKNSLMKQSILGNVLKGTAFSGLSINPYYISVKEKFLRALKQKFPGKNAPPFPLYIDKLMAMLCLESPVPVPGWLSVHLRLPVSKIELSDETEMEKQAVPRLDTFSVDHSDEIVLCSNDYDTSAGGGSIYVGGIPASSLEDLSNDFSNANARLSHKGALCEEKQSHQNENENDHEASSQKRDSKLAPKGIGLDHYGENKTTTLRASEKRESSKSRFYRTVKFTLPVVEDLPTCPFPVREFLDLFGARTAIDILCCVLAECRILFFSTNLARLPVVCEAVRTLIYPLKWTHVYLPVVPVQLLNLVEAPVPFILGTHTKWVKFVNMEFLSDVVLIDCDSGSIDLGSAITTKFPPKDDRWLMMALNTILIPVGCTSDTRDLLLTNSSTTELSERLSAHLHVNSRDKLMGPRAAAAEDSDPGFDESARLIRTDVDLQIQLLFFDVLFHLLRYVTECLFFLNPSCPVFNRPLFISDYVLDEQRPMLEFLTATNSFHELTESIYTPSLSFFLDSVNRLNEIEASIITNSMGLSTDKVGSTAVTNGSASSNTATSASGGERDRAGSTVTGMLAGTIAACSPTGRGRRGSAGGSVGGVNTTDGIAAISGRKGLLEDDEGQQAIDSGDGKAHRRLSSNGKSAATKALGRNVSVANIIYDKLVSAVPTPRSSSISVVGMSNAAGSELGPSIESRAHEAGKFGNDGLGLGIGMAKRPLPLPLSLAGMGDSNLFAGEDNASARGRDGIVGGGEERNRSDVPPPAPPLVEETPGSPRGRSVNVSPRAKSVRHFGKGLTRSISIVGMSSEATNTAAIVTESGYRIIESPNDRLYASILPSWVYRSLAHPNSSSGGAGSTAGQNAGGDYSTVKADSIRSLLMNRFCYYVPIIAARRFPQQLQQAQQPRPLSGGVGNIHPSATATIAKSGKERSKEAGEVKGHPIQVSAPHHVLTLPTEYSSMEAATEEIAELLTTLLSDFVIARVVDKSIKRVQKEKVQSDHKRSSRRRKVSNKSGKLAASAAVSTAASEACKEEKQEFVSSEGEAGDRLGQHKIRLSDELWTRREAEETKAKDIPLLSKRTDRNEDFPNREKVQGREDMGGGEKIGVGQSSAVVVEDERERAAQRSSAGSRYIRDTRDTIDADDAISGSSGAFGREEGDKDQREDGYGEDGEDVSGRLETEEELLGDGQEDARMIMSIIANARRRDSLEDVHNLTVRLLIERFERLIDRASGSSSSSLTENIITSAAENRRISVTKAHVPVQQTDPTDASVGTSVGNQPTTPAKVIRQEKVDHAMGVAVERIEKSNSFEQESNKEVLPDEGDPTVLLPHTLSIDLPDKKHNSTVSFVSPTNSVQEIDNTGSDRRRAPLHHTPMTGDSTFTSTTDNSFNVTASSIFTGSSTFFPSPPPYLYPAVALSQSMPAGGPSSAGAAATAAAGDDHDDHGCFAPTHNVPSLEFDPFGLLSPISNDPDEPLAKFSETSVNHAQEDVFVWTVFDLAQAVCASSRSNKYSSVAEMASTHAETQRSVGRETDTRSRLSEHRNEGCDFRSMLLEWHRFCLIPAERMTVGSGLFSTSTTTQKLAHSGGGAASGGGRRGSHGSSMTAQKIRSAHISKQIRCDDIILAFLQKVVTESDVDMDWLETTLQKCLKSLQLASNRAGIINVLKHAKKADTDKGTSSTVYPLNPSAFEAFSALFSGLLNICANQQDYLCAYGLLEIGGLYFRVIPQRLQFGGGQGQRLEGDAAAMASGFADGEGDGELDDVLEFLSERTCHHPIYQSSALWTAIMHDRLPVTSAFSNNRAGNVRSGGGGSISGNSGANSGNVSDNSAHSSSHLGELLHGASGAAAAASATFSSGSMSKKPSLSSNAIQSEAHTLLYIMLGLGVNSARALHFIQAVASSYSMGINDYYRLQRFTTRLWAQNSHWLEKRTIRHDQNHNSSIAISHGAANVGESLQQLQLDGSAHGYSNNNSNNNSYHYPTTLLRSNSSISRVNSAGGGVGFGASTTAGGKGGGGGGAGSNIAHIAHSSSGTGNQYSRKLFDSRSTSKSRMSMRERRSSFGISVNDMLLMQGHSTAATGGAAAGGGGGGGGVSDNASSGIGGGGSGKAGRGLGISTSVSRDIYHTSSMHGFVDGGGALSNPHASRSFYRSTDPEGPRSLASTVDSFAGSVSTGFGFSSGLGSSSFASPSRPAGRSHHHPHVHHALSRTQSQQIRPVSTFSLEEIFDSPASRGHIDNSAYTAPLGLSAATAGTEGSVADKGIILGKGKGNRIGSFGAPLYNRAASMGSSGMMMLNMPSSASASGSFVVAGSGGGGSNSVGAEGVPSPGSAVMGGDNNMSASKAQAGTRSRRFEPKHEALTEENEASATGAGAGAGPSGGGGGGGNISRAECSGDEAVAAGNGGGGRGGNQLVASSSESSAGPVVIAFASYNNKGLTNRFSATLTREEEPITANAGTGGGSSKSAGINEFTESMEHLDTVLGLSFDKKELRSSGVVAGAAAGLVVATGASDLAVVEAGNGSDPERAMGANAATSAQSYDGGSLRSEQESESPPRPCNKYSTMNLKGVEDGHATAFDTMGNWLIAGADDGSISVSDLTDGTLYLQMKHSSASSAGSKYQGVTALQCLPSSHASGSLFFSGCSHGILKVWNVPNKELDDDPNLASFAAPGVSAGSIREGGNASSAASAGSGGGGGSGEGVAGGVAAALGSSAWGKSMSNMSGMAGMGGRGGTNIRTKQSLAVIKTHTAPISFILAEPSTASSSSATSSSSSIWLLISGDTKGGITISRGSDSSSSTVSIGSSMRSNAALSSGSSHGGMPFAGGSGMNSSVFGGSAWGGSGYIRGFGASRSKNGFAAAFSGVSGFDQGQGSSKSPRSSSFTSGASSGSYEVSALALLTTSTHASPTHHQHAHGKGHAASDIGAGKSGAGVGGSGMGLGSGGMTGDSGLLAAGSCNGTVSVMDLSTGQAVYYLPEAHRGKVTKIIGLRSKEFLTCSLDRSIKLWDIRAKNRAGCVSYGNKGMERALGSDGYHRCSDSPITSMAIGGWDNSLVISASADGVVKIWDLRFDLNSPCSVLRGHSNRITSILWNGRTDFHTASHDGTVRSWDSINGQCVNVLPAFENDGIVQMSMTTFPCGMLSTPVAMPQRSYAEAGDGNDRLEVGKLLFRSCVLASSWNGVVRAFCHDSHTF